uniref:DDE Tnp4 domain-containing protein n=1 Tax=Brassica oleracea var. oleracea TaxID=109376 RepID=A0A0D3AS79_BRAOL
MDPSEFLFDIEVYKKNSVSLKRGISYTGLESAEIEEDHTSHSKRKYFKRDHVTANQRLIDDYFANQPTYDEEMNLYEQEYLRAPTQDDLQKILHVSEMRGFPGMIGSIDCMHWEWKNCPTVWEGQFTRGDKGTTTVILEAVASHDLWIWHAFFGCLGTLNDLNVLDRSPVFDDVEQGNTPRVKFFVNQRSYDMAYYLADGIYPSYPTFVK